MQHEQEKITAKQRSKKQTRLVVILSLIVVGMFVFGFALVPLYNVICDVTGLNGKVKNEASANSQQIDVSRVVTVELVATNNQTLPWKFYPLQNKITLHPGENKQINFYAKNESNVLMTVQAIPSITPGIAAKYLRKTECFCFRQQTLKSGEEKSMPVIFHIDPALPKEIKVLTLSYTLFNAAGIKPRPINETGKIR